MDINTKKFLQTIVQKAGEAADDARIGLESAGRAVVDKYDEARLGYELSRVKAEQELVFADIGRMVFYMSTGAFVENEDAASQKAIDNYLLVAEQKQQEIDALSDRLSELSKSCICHTCKRSCEEKDVFCSSCGAKLK